VGGESLFGRLSAKGASAQVAVAGAYAWVVTVAPSAWADGAPLLAKVAAGAALVALVAGAAGERRLGQRVRLASVWAFVLSSALTWSASPSSLAPRHMDPLGGSAGMLGWGLFALAAAGPSLGTRREAERVIVEEPLEARRRLGRGDAAYMLGGAVLGAAFQTVGWSEVSPERALLVRLVAVAAGLAVIGAVAEAAFARHAPRVRRRWRVRAQQAAVAFTLLGMLVVAGLLLGTTR
jgi:hypothetical protein